MKWDHPNSPYWEYIDNLKIAETEFEAKKQSLHAKLKTAQQLCKHENTTYHPDASGNNDSWTECDICGKDI